MLVSNNSSYIYIYFNNVSFDIVKENFLSMFK